LNLYLVQWRFALNFINQDLVWWWVPRGLKSREWISSEPSRLHRCPPAVRTLQSAMHCWPPATAVTAQQLLDADALPPRAWNRSCEVESSVRTQYVSREVVKVSHAGCLGCFLWAIGLLVDSCIFSPIKH
jgi:hypothetical protein